MERDKNHSIARFFFDVGYGACWAEAYICSGEKPPFDLTDLVVEHAWESAAEDYEDPAEFDRNLRAAASTDGVERALPTRVDLADRLAGALEGFLDCVPDETGPDGAYDVGCVCREAVRNARAVHAEYLALIEGRSA